MTYPFSSLGLSEPLAHAASDLSYVAPTPVQEKAIPLILQGRDVLAAAQTGTGKTAAYCLPIIQKISEARITPAARQVTALILAPTRELAAQIHDNIGAFSKYASMKTCLVFGGVNIKPQTAALETGVDILVATPGRLLDHLGQGHVDLSAVRFFVLDEADRMLDMGFIHDIQKILKLLPGNKQSMLLSATFSPDIRKLADSLLQDPVSVEISPNKDAALVQQQAYRIAKNRKRELLRDLIVDGKWEQVLVFTRMKHAANRLCQQLGKDGIEAAAIHGNKSQNARTRALSDFKERKVRVLVATDIAARGLDIEQLPHVVNYELPDVPEDYVHRIGRTGRAGMPGHAVSLVAPEDTPLLAAIEKLLKKKIELITPEGYEGPAPDDIAQDDEKAEAGRQRKTRRRGSSPASRKNASAAEETQKTAEDPQVREENSSSDRDPSAPARNRRNRRPAKKGKASPARSAVSAEMADPDNFGNSIHYQPQRKDPRKQASSFARYEPQDPFAPEHQALFLPQSMPGEKPYSAGLQKGNKRPQRPSRGNTLARATRSTGYFEQNSRYSDSLTKSNLPPGLIPRRNRSRGR